jgi:hypothetical protein
VPIPTYFTIGQNGLPELVKDKIHSGVGEVAQNLVFLGKLSGAIPASGSTELNSIGSSSVLTTAQGLKIGCIGGKYDVDHYVTEESVSLYGKRKCIGCH